LLAAALGGTERLAFEVVVAVVALLTDTALSTASVRTTIIVTALRELRIAVAVVVDRVVTILLLPGVDVGTDVKAVSALSGGHLARRSAKARGHPRTVAIPILIEVVRAATQGIFLVGLSVTIVVDTVALLC